MNVHVLLDDSAIVYGVVTDSEAADKWAELGQGFGVVEIEVDDYTVYNEVMDELEEPASAEPDDERTTGV